MKKSLLLFLITFTTITLISCKKDKSKNYSIIGKWQIESYVITNFENTGRDNDDTKGESPRPTLEFKDDGSLRAIFYFKDGTENYIDEVKVKYTISEDKLNLSGDLAFNHNSFTFSILNNILILKRTDLSSIGNNNSGTHTENTTVTAIRL